MELVQTLFFSGVYIRIYGKAESKKCGKIELGNSILHLDTGSTFQLLAYKQVVDNGCHETAM